MFDKFFPDEYVASTYVIAFEKLYEKGYRGVIFDIDNTLVPHGAPAMSAQRSCLKDLEKSDLNPVCFQITKNRGLRCLMKKSGQITFLTRTNRPQKIICMQWN